MRLGTGISSINNCLQFIAQRKLFVVWQSSIEIAFLRIIINWTLTSKLQKLPSKLTYFNDFESNLCRVSGLFKWIFNGNYNPIDVEPQRLEMKQISFLCRRRKKLMKILCKFCSLSSFNSRCWIFLSFFFSLSFEKLKLELKWKSLQQKTIPI